MKFCASSASGERGIGHYVIGAFWPWCLCPDLFRGTGSKVFPSSSQLTFYELCVGGLFSQQGVCFTVVPRIPWPWTSTAPWPIRNLGTNRS